MKTTDFEETSIHTIPGRLLLVSFVVAVTFAACQPTSESRNAQDSESESAVTSDDLDTDSGGEPLGRLSVEDGKLVDETGRQVILKGLGFGGMTEAESIGYWNEAYFESARTWGAKLIRLPVSPTAFQADPEGTLQSLDDAVSWCEKYGMYLIIDYHIIGNVEQGLFLSEESTSSTWEDLETFWTAAASRFADNPTAAFAEIYNEPSEVDFMGGSWAFSNWKMHADGLIALIREQAPEMIPLVAGLDYALDFSDGGEKPFEDPNIALAVHPYPGTMGDDGFASWDAAFGYLSDSYPIIFTELGFDPQDKINPSGYKGDLTYGRKVLTYAKDKSISWTAFVFYNAPWWPMTLFSDWDTLTPTISGLFFKDVLQGRDIETAGEDFADIEPVPNAGSNGPSGMFWMTWSDSIASVEWSGIPTRQHVGIHIEAPANAQGGIVGLLHMDGSPFDGTPYNKLEFIGKITSGKRSSISFGGNRDGEFHGCIYDVTGRGADTYTIDLLTPTTCVPENCYDLQATTVGFNNTKNSRADETDIGVDSVALMVNADRPLPTSEGICSPEN